MCVRSRSNTPHLPSNNSTSIPSLSILIGKGWLSSKNEKSMLSYIAKERLMIKQYFILQFNIYGYFQCSVTVFYFINFKQWIFSHIIRTKKIFEDTASFSPGASDDKESACSVGDLGLNIGLGRSPGERNGYPLQYCCRENSMDRGAWWATVHGVTVRQNWVT